MAKARIHRRAKASISVAMILGFAPTALWAYDGAKQFGVSEGLTRLVGRFTGYSMTEKKWQADQLVAGWAPIIAGILAHKIANKVGLNRMIRGMGIPIGI